MSLSLSHPPVCPSASLPASDSQVTWRPHRVVLPVSQRHCTHAPFGVSLGLHLPLPTQSMTPAPARSPLLGLSCRPLLTEEVLLEDDPSHLSLAGAPHLDLSAAMRRASPSCQWLSLNSGRGGLGLWSRFPGRPPTWLGPGALAFPSFLEPASWGNGTHRDGRVAYISRFLSFLRP